MVRFLNEKFPHKAELSKTEESASTPFKLIHIHLVTLVMSMVCVLGHSKSLDVCSELVFNV